MEANVEMARNPLTLMTGASLKPCVRHSHRWSSTGGTFTPNLFTETVFSLNPRLCSLVCDPFGFL